MQTSFCTTVPESWPYILTVIAETAQCVSGRERNSRGRPFPNQLIRIQRDQGETPIAPDGGSERTTWLLIVACVTPSDAWTAIYRAWRGRFPTLAPHPTGKGIHARPSGRAGPLPAGGSAAGNSSAGG
jgi:hypothetical protein